MTDKKLVFKVSDFLEEQGFLDVNEGEVPDEATRLSWQERRKKDDEYDIRQSNEVHTFSNVRPVFLTMKQIEADFLQRFYHI